MIHMQINSDKINFLVGNRTTLEEMSTIPALSMFSKQAMTFLSELSKALLSNRAVRMEKDIMSYAYWIRKASLIKARDEHTDYMCRIGRGVAFHIAPSNVPVNFAVSMTSSLLAGNATIIRVSSKSFIAVDIICKTINELLCGICADMRPYICIVRYEHDDEITQILSSMCDVRVIWGGNRTINSIRNASLPPRAIEMAFADRHSLAIINSDFYLKCNPEDIAKKFYTDTYYTDQNACSSPRIVVWTGESVEKARELFWKKLYNLVKRDYPMQPIQAVDKYTSFCDIAMSGEDVSIENGDNYLVRIMVSKLTSRIMDYKNGGGYFFEYIAKDLSDIVPVLDKRCQTISVLGIDKGEVKRLVFEYGVRGVDRIVPLGETMGLEFIWDGFKMIETMSRFIYTGSYK